jgi:2-dehydro-3-deoxygluconokinase
MKYGKTAGEVMAGLMPYLGVAIGNEEDCEKIFGIKRADVKVAGEVSAETYLVVARELMKLFSNLKKIAITLRGSISATHNTWSAVLYDGKRLYSTKKYDITNVIDRLGSGDAFTGALIYCLLAGKSDQEALDFAATANALKHSINSKAVQLGKSIFDARLDLIEITMRTERAMEALRTISKESPQMLVGAGTVFIRN